ncbi:FG-GAP-like repeat-containing protein [uncultured Draconibacterium sp.]|uniref:FG-GAP-like repeat-containing protein n=1 Tax=uncultured Draconibacterium sp. TaxID=1573823 RepID=UPI00321742ED
MTKQNYFLLFGLFFVFLAGCQSSAEKEKQDAVELMTAQTMGIAYLEEFKLEEAETEFLKYVKLAPEDRLGYANLGITYLRMGKYPEAEEQIQHALEIDAEDADIQLILATIYEMDNHREKAIAVLNDALKNAPNHAKVLYMLSELYSVANDAESQANRKACITNLAAIVPGNLVPQLSLTEIGLKENQADSTLARLEKIAKEFPEFPIEARDYYTATLDYLRKGDIQNAKIQFTIFHNYLKVTSPYQAGIMELKGPGGNLIGFPLIEYNKDLIVQDVEAKSYLDVIVFKEVSASAGINLPLVSETNASQNGVLSHVEVADYDGDGDIDIYTAGYDEASSSFKHHLYNNEMGRFTDVAANVGMDHTGNEAAATFIDYDNDGFLDLYILNEKGDILYRNADQGMFKNVSENSGIGNRTGGAKALFFDYDHDGDLDLFQMNKTGNQLFRNNMDGTFTDLIEKTGIPSDEPFKDAAFGDFDDDDDIDLLLTGASGTFLFSNQRQGIFKNVSEECGLSEAIPGTAIDVADINNDGFLDFFVTSETPGEIAIFQNHGNAQFGALKGVSKMFGSLAKVKTTDVRFFDFDNDGYQDIIIAGNSTVEGARGLFLYHNEAPGEFADVSHLLPENVKSARQIELFDYNDDGDIDILLAGVNGGLLLLRNDGGNINHYVDMKLVGLRTGSAKNNHFGIGAKVEMRSGDLYQTQVVTSPGVHFGLGHRKNADIIRITWTNGVPQNIFRPGVDQALIEAQTLKGSCPFVYAWNGNEYQLVKDITWRSALGMPLGIMGENTAYAFADASDDYIKIPGKFLKEKEGKYSIRITSELWETIYMDRVRLAVADHPANTDVFVPEQFGPPPFPGYKLYTVSEKKLPVCAIDQDGNDVLSFIEKEDDNYLAGFNSDKYQGLTEMHTLTLSPEKNTSTNKLHLFLKGWIFPTDASINAALSQSNAIEVVSPVIQVVNSKGEWQTVLKNVGFPMGKDKTVIIDLSDKFLSADHRVRILTNMEIYWDYIFFSNVSNDIPVTTTILDPVSADIHYRGFSRSYRKGGRYGPHWFDYYDVDTNTKWVDLTGNYTRYGDVLPLLLASDNQYIISNAGDETSIEFNAGDLPELPEGWTRDFFIHSVGWVKDGDLNTAFGNQVEPLPYHGMKNYPPLAEDVYPDDEDLKQYHSKYNNRVVTTENYRNFIKDEVYSNEKK